MSYPTTIANLHFQYKTAFDALKMFLSDKTDDELSLMVLEFKTKKENDKVVKTPKVSAPKVSAPKVSAPKVSAPDVSTPKVSKTKVSKTKVSNAPVQTPTDELLLE